MTITWQEAGVRLLVATVLGMAIGWERERSHRAAGLRTHALVALACALMSIVSAYGFQIAGMAHPDPTRIAAQIVSGVGFLGAGAIIFSRGSVRGLTTAASLWMAAGIGIAAGTALFSVAAEGTFLALVVLIALRPVERRLIAPRRERSFRLTIDPRRFSLADLRDTASSAPGGLSGTHQHVLPAGTNVVDVLMTSSKGARSVLEQARSMPGVEGVTVPAPLRDTGEEEEEEETPGDAEALSAEDPPAHM